MSATIHDVANLASVAPSTVSRVISDSSLISDKTKRKVRKAMEELNYHPNLNARNLASQSTQTIGVVMPDSASSSFQNPFFPEILRGISSYANTKEYSLLLLTGESSEEILDGVKKVVLGKRVDGIIVLYSQKHDKITDYLFETKFPFVIVGKPYQNENNINFVDNDNYSAARKVTDLFIKAGHERIAFVAGNMHFLVTSERYNGYADALKLADKPYRQEYVYFSGVLIESGIEAVDKLMNLPQPPTAIVTADDLLSIGILSGLSQRNISVPNDVAIIGFNNILLAEIISPRLSSVDLNTFQLGIEGAKLLIEKSQSKDTMAKSVIIPNKIIQRQSCGTLNHSYDGASKR